MKVLWVLGEVPIPADSGARLRILGLLKPLAARHDVTAAVLDPGPAGQASLRELEQICSKVAVLPWRGRSQGIGMVAGAALNLLSPWPYSVARYCTADTEQCLSELAARPFDIIQCENIGFHRYLRSPASAPRVLGTHNVEADVWRQRARLSRNPILSAYLGRQAARMARYEGDLTRSYDWVTAVTEPDAARLQADYGIQNVTVVPNGVDTEYFMPAPEPPEPNLVLFTGAMDYAPNDDAMRYFLDRIWHRVASRIHAARLEIVGRAPSDHLRRLANASPGLTLTGWVPDTRPYLARASVVVVPLRIGGGSRLKILEAMAMRKPVVSTSVGAAGLGVAANKHLLIADEPDGFAEHVVSILANDGHGTSMASAGFSFVTQHHTWSELSRRLERAWETARPSAGVPADALGRRLGQAR